MTIQGAIYELNNMLFSNDIPFYWKPAIKKIIETVEQSEQNVGMCQQNVGEMSEKQRTDGDLISRDSAIKLVNYALAENKDVLEVLENMPSAEKTANKININEYVKVKLTDYGKEIFYHQYDEINSFYKCEKIKPHYPKIDKEGYTSFQLWHFMNLYGNYIDMGMQNVIEPLEIVFESAEKTAECKDMGEVSDGYHTFNQLYHQRAILFATIVNQNKNISWKSFKHEDGNYCFDKNGDWFIVGVDTPEGSYTYHYEKKYWDYFKCKELETAKHWMVILKKMLLDY